MRYLIKGLIALGILLTGMLATVVIVLSTVDLNAYRDEISAIAEHSTGRRLTIEGDIDKRMLTLSPRIVVNRVAFGNALWGTRPDMITADRVELVLDLLPLLTGTLSVKRIDIVGADMLLETDPKGIANWELSGDAIEPASRLNPAAVPTVKDLRITASRLSYVDGKTGLRTVLRVDRLRARMATYGDGILLETAGTWDGTEIRGSGTLGSIRAFLSRSREFPIRLDYAYGNSLLAADLVADLSGRLPVVTGELRSDRLDIDELGRGGPARSGGAVFDREPFGVGALNAAKGEVALKAKQVIVGGRTLANVTGTLKLAKGKLVVEPFTAGFAGGTLAGAITFDAGIPAPRLDVEITGRDIALADVTGTRLLSTRLVLEGRFSGEGVSMHALVSTLEGKLVAEGGRGTVDSGAVRLLSSDILAAIPLVGRDGGSLALNCVVLRFDVSAGLARSRVMLADTTRFSVLGSGTVDLRREGIDLLFVATTKGTSIASVAALVPVRVRGPLLAPAAAPDPGAAAREAAGALIRLADFPLDIVGSLVGRERSGRRTGAPCPGARAQARGDPGTGQGASGGPGRRGMLDRINPLKR